MGRRKPLEPPDVAQCQAEISSYNAFVMGGPTHQVTRCPSPAAWVAKETVPGDDGRKGAMSLCSECRLRLVQQFTEKHQALPRFTRITVKGEDHGKSC